MKKGRPLKYHLHWEGSSIAMIYRKGVIPPVGEGLFAIIQYIEKSYLRLQTFYPLGLPDNINKG
jgi:hypothetical protein